MRCQVWAQRPPTTTAAFMSASPSSGRQAASEIHRLKEGPLAGLGTRRLHLGWAAGLREADGAWETKGLHWRPRAVFSSDLCLQQVSPDRAPQAKDREDAPVNKRGWFLPLGRQSSLCLVSLICTTGYRISLDHFTGHCEDPGNL